MMHTPGPWRRVPIETPGYYIDQIEVAEGHIASVPGWSRFGARCPGHRQLVGLRPWSGAIRTACPWLRCSGDAGDLGPSLEGLGPGSSILDGWNLVAAEVEEVVDPVMGGQEALCLAG